MANVIVRHRPRRVTLETYAPMLAVSWETPFDDERWAFEPKLDGVRAIVSVQDGSVRIRSRNGNDITPSYPELASLETLGDGTILDGEIIAYDEEGVPSFERLQGRMHRTGPSPIAVSLVAFDLLALNGEALVGQTLMHRLVELGDLDLPKPALRSTVIEGEGVALFAAAAARGLEGIMAKRYDSTYRPGVRSSAWRKIPHILRTRAIVCGFTESGGTRTGVFGALLLGMWDGAGLRFVGSVGTGFDHAEARAIRDALDQMISHESPFGDDPAVPDGRFVHPHLVAEIAFKQWTKAGRFRAPSFKGFSDRSHEEVTWRAEGPTTANR